MNEQKKKKKYVNNYVTYFTLSLFMIVYFFLVMPITLYHRFIAMCTVHNCSFFKVIYESQNIYSYLISGMVSVARETNTSHHVATSRN